MHYNFGSYNLLVISPRVALLKYIDQLDVLGYII